MRENGLNEKLIQQVLEIEKQAQAIHEVAVREAGQLPTRAEQEAQALIEKARADAQEQARQLAADAQAQEEAARTSTPDSCRSRLRCLTICTAGMPYRSPK